MPPRKRLGQLLLEIGVIDEHQLQSALGHQKQWGGKLGGILVQKGFAKEEQVVSALSTHLGMPLVRLAGQKVDPRAIKCVSRQVAEKLHVFPYEITGSGRAEVVTVAMSDPTDLSAVDQLAFHTGKRVKPILAGHTEIVQAIALHYGSQDPKAAPAQAPAGAHKAAPGAPSAAAPRASTSPGAQVARRVQPRKAATAAPPRKSAVDPGHTHGADAQVEGLEPIAAHTQFGEGVAGREEVAGDGAAGDAVEGLESASLAHQETSGVVAAERVEGLEPIAAHAQSPADDPWAPPALANSGWDPPPPPVASWDPQDVQALDAALEHGERLPTGAILGAALDHDERLPTGAILGSAPEKQPGAPDGWTSPGTPDGWSEPASSAPAAGSGWTHPIPALPPSESPGEPTPPPVSPAIPEAIGAGHAGERPAAFAHETEAPDAWGATEDPLATAPQDRPPPATAERKPRRSAVPLPAGSAEGTEAVRETTQRFALGDRVQRSSGIEAEVELEEEEIAANGSARGALIDGAPPPSQERDETEPGEGWIAPASADPAWAGDVAGAGPLSPADAGTLASLGVAPHDGVGAMRLLAALVRILNRRQLLDLEEVAAEVRSAPGNGLHDPAPGGFDERA